jgi:hypothetical protein
MLLFLSIFFALLLFIFSLGTVILVSYSGRHGRKVVLDQSAVDARAVSRLANPVLGLPTSAVVQSRLSTLRYSQTSHLLMEGLAKRVGLTYPDIITMVENKFTRVDRKVFQMLNIVSENERRKPVAQIQEIIATPRLSEIEPILRVEEEVSDDTVTASELNETESDSGVSVEHLTAEEPMEAGGEPSPELISQEIPQPPDPRLEVSGSHEIKYGLLLEKLDALITETRVVQFLEKFTDLNDYLNAYIAQLDSQLTQVRKVRSLDLLGSRNINIMASGDA